MNTRSYETEIRSEWADYNGHFNVAYYTLVFDDAALDLVERRLKYALGDSSLSITTADIEYSREVKVGRKVRVDTIVLAVDSAALHLLQTMRETEEGYVAAVEERIVCLRDGTTGGRLELPRDLRAAADAMRAAGLSEDIPDGRPKLTLEIIR